MKKLIDDLATLFLALLLMLSLSATGFAERIDEHEHVWVRSNFSGLRTCSECGRQLRDIADESIFYTVPYGWTRYRGEVATLWFVNGDVEEGAVYIYTVDPVDKSDILLLRELAEVKADGKLISESFTPVAGREAYRAEYQNGQKQSFVLAFADTLSRKAWVFVAVAEEWKYEPLMETFEEVIDSVSFDGDLSLPVMQNTMLPSAKIEVQEEYLYSNDYGMYAVAILENHTEVTADILAEFTALDQDGNPLETVYSLSYSVAPGEAVAVKSDRFSNPASITAYSTEVYAEPAVYYESLWDKSGFECSVSDLGRSQLLIVENNSELTAVRVDAQFLYFKDGDLAYVDTQTLVYGSDPLYPGEKASAQSWDYSFDREYDELLCSVSARGMISDQPATESPVEIIGEFVLKNERSSYHYLVVKNISEKDCKVVTDTLVYDVSGAVLEHTTNYGCDIPAGDMALIEEYVLKSGVDRFITTISIGSYSGDRISQQYFELAETQIPGGLIVSVKNNGGVEAKKVWIKALFFKIGEPVACEETEITDDMTTLPVGETITKALLPNLEFDEYQLFVSAEA